jgi:hypothetical protein
MGSASRVTILLRHFFSMVNELPFRQLLSFQIYTKYPGGPKANGKRKHPSEARLARFVGVFDRQLSTTSSILRM